MGTSDHLRGVSTTSSMFKTSSGGLLRPSGG
jgi:hypothetical protein